MAILSTVASNDNRHTIKNKNLALLSREMARKESENIHGCQHVHRSYDTQKQAAKARESAYDHYSQWDCQ
ncbi:hypothetical protein KSD_45210 [Ktedonobacter sp. SOSP1-85]|nr:hypothetical protein KSD_45210 [Ktedonobacter sp. SOSP1-85]